MSLLVHKQLGLAGGIIAVALNARDESVGAFQGTPRVEYVLRQGGK